MGTYPPFSPLFLLLIFFLTILLPYPLHTRTPEKIKKELQEEQRKLKEKEKEYEKIRQNLERLEKEQYEISLKIREKEKKLIEILQNRKEMEKKEMELEKSLSLKKKYYSYLLAFAWSWFRGGGVETRILPGKTEEYAYIQGLAGYTSKMLLSEMKMLLSTLMEGKKIRESIETSLIEEKKALQTLEQDRYALSQLLQEKKIYESRLKKDIQMKKQYLKDLEEKLNFLLKDLSSSSPTWFPTPTTFLPPVQGPILLRFGLQKDPVFQVELHHTGWTYKVPRGTPVKASGEGRVVYARWFQGYGNLVILGHGGGWYTLYGYLENIVVKENSLVAQGEVLGYSGSSGSLYGEALRFEIRKGKTPVDPGKILLR
jgi:septal ring factor EnvC (AmiA/AmiB activator)